MDGAGFGLDVGEAGERLTEKPKPFKAALGPKEKEVDKEEDEEEKDELFCGVNSVSLSNPSSVSLSPLFERKDELNKLFELLSRSSEEVEDGKLSSFPL